MDAHAKTMGGLKRKLGELRTFIPSGDPVLYLDYPMHLNIGDQLINLGTEAWFADHGYTVTNRASHFDCSDRNLRKVGADSTIVLHGGGNFGDIYPVHQEFREYIVGRFRNNRIVVMPQSVHFKSTDRLRVAAEIFSRHPRLTIAVRDTESFDLLTKHFKNDIRLFPDMAHQLWSRPDMTAGSVGRATDGANRTLVLWRQDIEAVAKPAGFAQDRDLIDWEALMTANDIRVYKAILRWYRLDRRLGHLFPNHLLWYPIRARLVNRMICLFRSYDNIVTNRLHAMILGALLSRNVEFSDNSYGKLSRYWSAWLKDSDLKPVPGTPCG